MNEKELLEMTKKELMNQLNKLENEFFDEYHEAVSARNSFHSTQDSDDSDSYEFHQNNYESLAQEIKKTYDLILEIDPDFEYEFEWELESLFYFNQTEKG